MRMPMRMRMRMRSRAKKTMKVMRVKKVKQRGGSTENRGIPAAAVVTIPTSVDEYSKV
jgi:hypothetical protein